MLYIDNGDVVTSADVAAGLDCCLHIVRVRYGAEAALLLARQIVLVSPSARRAGAIHRTSHRQDRECGPLHTGPRDGAQNAGRDAQPGQCRRHRRPHPPEFTRRFQKSIGTSFGDWLTDQRIALAQRLLESTEKSMDMVAFEAGFGSAASLRQHFAARLKTSPVQYRREFSKNAQDERAASR